MLLRLVEGARVDLTPFAADDDMARNLIEQVDFHRLGFQLVECTDFAARVDEGGAATLDRYLKGLRIRRAFLDPLARRGIEFIGQTLDEHSIAWCVIKGPALLAYTPPGETRDFRDLDVLVSAEQFERAVEALEIAGAVLLDQNFEMLAEIISGEVTLLLPNGLPLDLHWNPVHTVRNRRGFRWSSDDLLSRARRGATDSFGFPTLDPNDNLLYVAVHAGLSGGYRLLWIRDLLNALHHTAWNLDMVLGRAAEARTSLVAAVVFDEVSALTGDPQAAALARALAPRSGWRLLLAVVRAVERRLPRSNRRPSWGMFRSTRDTTLHSSRAYVGSSVRRALNRPAYSTLIPGEQPSVADLRRPTAPISRDRFFNAVRARSGHGGVGMQNRGRRTPTPVRDPLRSSRAGPSPRDRG